MKFKQLAIILVLLVLLGGAALLLSRRGAASWSKSATHSDAKLLEFPLNEVTRITIKGAGGELNLAKKEDVWVVQERADYPADFGKVG